MTDEMIHRVTHFIRTSLYEGKKPDDEGCFIFTRKELIEGAGISSSSFDGTIAWSLEKYFDDASYNRGRLILKSQKGSEHRWCTIAPLDYRFVYEYYQGGWRRVSGDKVIFDAYPHSWTDEQITEYNKAHGIFKSSKGELFDETDWRYAVKNGTRNVYRLASGNYLEVDKDPNPINPREYASGLGKLYLFQRDVRMDESPDFTNMGRFLKQYELSTPAVPDRNIGPSTADSSKGILIIPIRTFNYHLYHFGKPTYPGDNYFDRAAHGAAVVSQDDIDAMGLDANIKEQLGIEQITDILRKELYDYNAYLHKLMYEMRIYNNDGVEMPAYRHGNCAAWVETDNKDFAISYMLMDMGILNIIHAMGDEIIENLGNVCIKDPLAPL